MRFGRPDIPYGIRRSPRRKTVSVAVDPEDGVVLTAPPSISLERLAEVVRDGAPWIIAKLTQAGQGEGRPEPRGFVSGESFFYLGRQYRLRVFPRKYPGAAMLVVGWLQVEVETRLKGRRRALAVRDALVCSYRERAGQRVRERVQAWVHAAAGNPGDVIIADQRRRWASCDASGHLRINWRVVQMPLRLVDLRRGA